MLSSGVPVLGDPGLAPPMQSLPRGISADLIATRNGHSRDDVDAYAVESQRRAARAWDEGRFAASVVPVADRLGLLILDRDEAMRPDATMQGMGALRPALEGYAKKAGFGAVAMQLYPEVAALRHVHTAANSSQIVDGAAAVLIGRADAGRAGGCGRAPGCGRSVRSGPSRRSC